MTNEATLTLASAEQLSSPVKRRYKKETLPVSGWNVRIQSLMAGEMSRYQAVTYADSGTALKRSRLEDSERRLISLCLVDDAGNRILNGSHISTLASWDSADASYLFNACATHVGIKTEDIEDLVKNSSEIPVVE